MSCSDLATASSKHSFSVLPVPIFSALVRHFFPLATSLYEYGAGGSGGGGEGGGGGGGWGGDGGGGGELGE